MSKRLQWAAVALVGAWLAAMTSLAVAQADRPGLQMEMEGVVERIDLGGRLLISDAVFEVPARAELYRVDGEPMRLGDLRLGDRVLIRYDVRGEPQRLWYLQRLERGIAR